MSVPYKLTEASFSSFLGLLVVFQLTKSDLEHRPTINLKTFFEAANPFLQPVRSFKKFCVFPLHRKTKIVEKD